MTEAGRQGVPLGEVMVMTEHRSVGTVMGDFQAGALLDSRATQLLNTPVQSKAVPSSLSMDDRCLMTMPA